MTGVPNTIASIMDRLLIDDAGCWNWTGKRSKTGYGDVRYNGQTCRVHRLIYEHFEGQIPTGLVLDHLCRNPSCANPDHLEPVTNHENSLRGDSYTHQKKGVLRKSRCPRGHLYDEENTYIRYKRTGNIQRTCRRCRRKGA